MSTTLEDAAAARKEKLLALRKRKAEAESCEAPREAFRFRNYDPESGQARRHSKNEEVDTVEKDVEGLAAQVIEEDRQRRAQELDLTNIQPKKPNWDLKRDLDKRLAKLEPKTESAIAHLIRRRIAAERAADKGDGTEQDGVDLANAVEGRDFSKEAADSDEDMEG